MNLAETVFFSVDASSEGNIGRFVNHSRKKPNCKMIIDEKHFLPKLYLFAIRDISKGEEILYDYGDRDPATLRDQPWLKN